MKRSQFRDSTRTITAVSPHKEEYKERSKETVQNLSQHRIISNIFILVQENFTSGNNNFHSPGPEILYHINRLMKTLAHCQKKITVHGHPLTQDIINMLVSTEIPYWVGCSMSDFFLWYSLQFYEYIGQLSTSSYAAIASRDLGLIIKVIPYYKTTSGSSRYWS